MSRRRATWGLLSLLLLPACGLITGPGEDDRLADAKHRWSSSGLGDYVYEVRSDCFCGLAGRWIEVTVIGGQVASGKYVDTNTPVEHNFLPALPTVADLFTRIQNAIDAHAVLLEVQYDPGDGHPVRINVDVSHRIADEEYLLQSRNMMGLLTAGDAAPTR